MSPPPGANYFVAHLYQHALVLSGSISVVDMFLSAAPDSHCPSQALAVYSWSNFIRYLLLMF